MVILGIIKELDWYLIGILGILGMGIAAICCHFLFYWLGYRPRVSVDVQASKPSSQGAAYGGKTDTKTAALLRYGPVTYREQRNNVNFPSSNPNVGGVVGSYLTKTAYLEIVATRTLEKVSIELKNFSPLLPHTSSVRSAYFSHLDAGEKVTLPIAGLINDQATAPPDHVFFERLGDDPRFFDLMEIHHSELVQGQYDIHAKIAVEADGSVEYMPILIKLIRSSSKPFLDDIELVV